MASGTINAETMSDGEGDWSDTALREAHLAAADPEVTLFLESIAWRAADDAARPARSWNEFVEAGEGVGELGRLDGHILRECVAEGGMATVFRAEEPALSRYVALKMLAPDLADDPRARERFLKEAKAAAGLEHANVLPIYRVVEGEATYFTMRHAAGGTLQDRLDREGRLSVADWFSLARQVGAALVAAHGAGLIHRDVKPANLLYDECGDRIWVADFGVASRAEEGTEFRRPTVLGTPRYMSPEQSRGEAVDGRSDLFALGAVLYRCAAGEDLVPGDSSPEVLEQLAQMDFAAVARTHERIPKAQRRLLAGLLATDPEDRFASAADFLDALGRETSKRRTSYLGGIVAASIVAALAWLLLSAKPYSDREMPALPSIRIEGQEGVFRDFEAALSAAPDGSTLLLDGIFVCRRVHFGPVGRRLTLRPAPGAHAVVIASRSDEHALFLRGPTTLVGIDFLREESSGPTKPIVGIHGGDAVVRDCRFESGAVEGDPFGAALSFTFLGKALVENCVFDMPGMVAIFYGFVEGSPPMEVTLRDSVFLAASLAMRRAWEGRGEIETRLERCAVVADRLFLENPRNDPAVPVAPAFELRFCWLDLAASTVHYANGRTLSEASPSLSWKGSGNRHAVSGLRLSNALPAAPFEATEALGVEFSQTLASPFAGSERSPTIRALRPPRGGVLRFADLLKTLQADPEFSGLAGKSR